MNYIPSKLYSVGGGTKNTIWSQTTSDIIGLNQILRKTTLGASYGDAFLAAYAKGDLNKEDINTWNAVDREIIAQSENLDIYNKGYKYFRKLYESTKDLMKEMDE